MRTCFLLMRKSADQREVDQRLCFRYSTIILLSESEISSRNHLLWWYSLACVSSDRKLRRYAGSLDAALIEKKGLLTIFIKEGFDICKIRLCHYENTPMQYTAILRL